MKHIEAMGRIAVLVFALTPSVVAQTAEVSAGARAAAEAGVNAFAEGRWADAADLMTRAEKLVHAPTHLLYLAQAEEKLGHLVIAHETYLRILREKLANNAPKVFVSAQAEAKQRAEAVRVRLSQVSIVVQGNPAGAKVAVTMDGREVPAVLIGVPHPIDPGEHQFEATAEGKRSGLAKVVLGEGASETVVLSLQPSAATPPAAPVTMLGPGATPVPAAAGSSPQAAPPTPVATQPTNPPTAAPKETSGMHPLKLGGYIGLGVGVAGVAVGSIFAVSSLGSRNDANALCNGPNGTCPIENGARIKDLDSSANSAGTLAVVGFAVGGVGVAAGLTMLLMAPSQEQPPKTAFMAPYVTGNGGGVWGRF
jgi:hypothetical protein